MKWLLIDFDEKLCHVRKIKGLAKHQTANEEAKKKIKAYLHNIDNQYDKIQEEAVIEDFAGVLHGNHKELNAIQKLTGYEVTSYLKQEIKYSKVLSKHMELVREE